MDDWLKDIKPTVPEELIGNEKQKQQILNWIKNTKKMPLLISGPIGCSKTTFVKVILKNNNYDPKLIYLSDFSSSKELREFIEDLGHNDNVSNFFTQEVNKKKKAIIIDDFENSSSHYKKIISNIIDLSNFFPVVFISCLKHHNLLDYVKKNSIFVEFNNLTYENMWVWCNSVVQIKKIKITQKLINDIIHASNSDINQMIVWVFQIDTLFKTGKKTPEIRNILLNSPIKQANLGLIDATFECCQKKCTIKDADILYDLDRILLPRMIHENIYNNKLKISDIVKSTYFFSLYDIFYNKIHAPPHDDSLHGLTSTIVCWCIPLILNDNQLKQKFTGIYHNKIRFPKLMTIRYQTFVNKNNLKILPYFLKNERFNMNIIGNLLRKIVEKNKIDQIIYFIKKTGLEIRYIDIILKLSSLNLDKKIRLNNQKQKKIREIMSS